MRDEGTSILIAPSSRQSGFGCPSLEWVERRVGWGRLDPDGVRVVDANTMPENLLGLLWVLIYRPGSREMGKGRRLGV